MFADLLPVFGFGEHTPPRGQCLYLSDAGLDGGFLLHHFLSLFLKGGNAACLVATEQVFSHYLLVGKRMGLNLAQLRDTQKLTFIDLLSPPSPLRMLASDPSALFSSLLSQMQAMVSATTTPLCLLVEDLSIFLTLGAAPAAVLDFVRNMRALALMHPDKVAVVFFMHTDADTLGSVAAVNAYLSYACDVHMHVAPLKTGASRDMHGQITVTRHDRHSLPTYRPLLFRARDTTVSFFAPGTSSAVL